MYASARVRRAKSEVEEKNRVAMIDVHLPATEDKALLRRGNTRLLLNFLLDPSDLCSRDE